MNLPSDIKSCHELILQLTTALERITPQVERYVQIIESQRLQIESQRLQIEELEIRIKELEFSSKQNSSNSNRPPSSDLYRTKPAFPRAKGGKVGGKVGHDGTTLKMSEQVDHIIQYHVSNCCHCGKHHSKEALTFRARRQVFDIPEPRIEVTEHQAMDWMCSSCSCANAASFPEGVNAPVQYGKRIQTMSVLLNNAYNVTRNKVQLIFKDLYGIDINESTLQEQNAFAYAQLGHEEAYILSQLQKSTLLHVDETGIYVGKERHWEHVLCNEKYTHMFVHPSRGMKAHEAQSQNILTDYQGWLVHDCWQTYFNFPNSNHALCGAHLLRELYALKENHSLWAAEFHSFLYDLYVKSDFGNNALPDKKKKGILKAFKRLIKMADKEEPPAIPSIRGKPSQTKGRNLLDRLQLHMETVIAFAFNEIVPFTNNQAERDIRPTKSKLKISGCFRTDHGARYYARIQSFISTVRKHNGNLFNELFEVLSGNIPQYRIVLS